MEYRSGDKQHIEHDDSRESRNKVESSINPKKRTRCWFAKWQSSQCER